MTKSLIPTQLSEGLRKLILGLDSALASGDRLTPKQSAKILEAAAVKKAELLPYEAFDHPETDNYGRKLICDRGQYEVMVMSWNPGAYSSIHNHGSTQWGCVQVFGHARHHSYTYRKQTLALARTETLPAGRVMKVNHTLIHQMGNPGPDPFLSLHIYGTHVAGKGITDRAANYDVQRGQIVYASGGAFFEIPEKDAEGVEPILRITEEVKAQQAIILEGLGQHRVTGKSHALRSETALQFDEVGCV